jgi:hypothetical protein
LSAPCARIIWHGNSSPFTCGTRGLRAPHSLSASGCGFTRSRGTAITLLGYSMRGSDILAPSDKSNISDDCVYCLLQFSFRSVYFNFHVAML